jgi:uncharacterized protein YjcR
MKKKIYFYKSWLASFRLHDLIPCLGFSRNVQGWFYTRTWSVNFLTYCLQLSIVNTSDLNEERSIAHEKNCLRVMNAAKKSKQPK